MPHPQAYAEVNYATFVTPTQAGILAVAEIPPHRFRYAVTLIFVISDIRDLVLRRKSMGQLQVFDKLSQRSRHTELRR